MFFLNTRVNEDIINEDDNEQVQVLFGYSVHQSMKVVEALVIPKNITTNS